MTDRPYHMKAGMLIEPGVRVENVIDRKDGTTAHYGMTPASVAWGKKHIRLANEMPDGMLEIETDDFIVDFANETFQETTGHKALELVGYSVLDLVPGTHRAAYQKRLEEYRDTPDKTLELIAQEFLVVYKDGSVRDVNIRFIKQGGVDTIVAIIQFPGEVEASSEPEDDGDLEISEIKDLVATRRDMTEDELESYLLAFYRATKKLMFERARRAVLK